MARLTSLPSSPRLPQGGPARQRGRVWLKALGVVAGLGLVGALGLGVAAALYYPTLPDLKELTDYQPKLPLRVYSADDVLIGEFGTERRRYLPLKDIPKLMQDALLAVEDARFREHGGVDPVGILRAVVSNSTGGRRSGASTITQQLARTVYLSREQKLSRKLYEMLLATKMERELSKDQILEIYMNQIYLGQRAYGFEAAAGTYFGKSLKELSIAEVAMLAGLPQNPANANPAVNFDRAQKRQWVVLERMKQVGLITDEQQAQAKAEKLHIKARPELPLHAEYVAELVRQTVFQQYGEEAYTRGLVVHTTLDAQAQAAAYKAVRKGILDYERRQVYRGPEAFIDLPQDEDERDDAVSHILAKHPDQDDLKAAVVLTADRKLVKVVTVEGDEISVQGDGLKPVASGLSDKAGDKLRIRPGAVVRIQQVGKGWAITQQPEVEAGLVAVDPRTGQVRALVGGFDFAKNQFNHVTQAMRQPGSSFKPFVYSAALEKGFSGATVVNDAPFTDDPNWDPKNYDGTFEGPMAIRQALAKSKNMVTIRVLQAVTPPVAKEWIAQFGLDPDKHPENLTMALGSGSLTPLQSALGYSVFANGGYRITPQFITRISDAKGNVLSKAEPKVLSEDDRAIPARNAYVMSSLLQEITRSGTAAKAQATLKRPDVYGKTGTTNDAMDAWFAGYHPELTAVVWIGYDTPRSLGVRETGGGLSLPIWIDFMQVALKGKPVVTYPLPSGLVQDNGEWFYEEFAGGQGVTSLGLKVDAAASAASAP